MILISQKEKEKSVCFRLRQMFDLKEVGKC